jgi:hypothetical protein
MAVLHLFMFHDKDAIYFVIFICFKTRTLYISMFHKQDAIYYVIFI